MSGPRSKDPNKPKGTAEGEAETASNTKTKNPKLKNVGLGHFFNESTKELAKDIKTTGKFRHTAYQTETKKKDGSISKYFVKNVVDITDIQSDAEAKAEAKAKSIAQNQQPTGEDGSEFLFDSGNAAPETGEEFLFNSGNFSADEDNEEELNETPPEVKTKQQVEAPVKLKDNMLTLTARREVLAQEIIRLFLPNHPKTKLMIDEKQGVFVASKAVQNCEAIAGMYIADNKAKKEGVEDHTYIRDNIKNGTFKGFGHMVVMALYVDEHDFKPSNMVLADNRFIKIDGDWCFGRMQRIEMNKMKYEREKYDNPFLQNNEIQETAEAIQSRDITEKTIRRLPYVSDYDQEGYTWLDEKVNGELFEDESILLLDHDMINNEYIRNEINEQLLKILLMPNDMIEQMIRLHIPTTFFETQEHLEQFMTNRAERFKIAAMENPSFTTYLKSKEAEVVCDKFQAEVKAFKPAGLEKTEGAKALLQSLTDAADAMPENLSSLRQEALQAEMQKQSGPTLE